MRVLVTGADGFVGSRLVPRLAEIGHEITAGVHAASAKDPSLKRRHALESVADLVELDVTDGAAVDRVARTSFDAVVHLGAISSGRAALDDPGRAWEVNAGGTARLASAFARGRRPNESPVFLLASTGDVYGSSERQRPWVETDPTKPLTPYAASKLGAEIAATEILRRTGLRIIIARAFGHTGGAQDDRFVVPAFAQRILTAKRIGAPVVEVGNLDVTREFMHVDDVVDAYCRLIERGRSGEIYNVASGSGVRLEAIFDWFVSAVGHHVIAEVDSGLVRPVDVSYSVGDGSKLAAATGWRARRSLEETLTEVLDAQAN